MGSGCNKGKGLFDAEGCVTDEVAWLERFESKMDGVSIENGVRGWVEGGLKLESTVG